MHTIDLDIIHTADVGQWKSERQNEAYMRCEEVMRAVQQLVERQDYNDNSGKPLRLSLDDGSAITYQHENKRDGCGWPYEIKRYEMNSSSSGKPRREIVLQFLRDGEVFQTNHLTLLNRPH
jgi:hypothetical protein